MGDRVRRYFVEPPSPRLVLEFSSVAVTGVRVEPKGGRGELAALASEPLPDGALTPSLEDPGFADKEALRDALKRVLARTSATAGMPSALIVPDVLARFRLFAPEEVRAEPKERDSVVAFRMQKLLPFSAAEMRVVSAWPASSLDPILGIGFSTTVFSAYEQIGNAFGLDVGSVETSSMALLRGVPLEGDALLVRHDPAWLTLTLIRNGWPVAIRSFDASVSRHPDETRREISSTAVFWKDRLQGTRLSHSIVHAPDSWFETLKADLSASFGLEPRRAEAPPSLSVPGVPGPVQRLAVPALTLLGAS